MIVEFTANIFCSIRILPFYIHLNSFARYNLSKFLRSLQFSKYNALFKFILESKNQVPENSRNFSEILLGHQRCSLISKETARNIDPLIAEKQWREGKQFIVSTKCYLCLFWHL